MVVTFSIATGKTRDVFLYFSLNHCNHYVLGGIYGLRNDTFWRFWVILSLSVSTAAREAQLWVMFLLKIS